MNKKRFLLLLILVSLALLAMPQSQNQAKAYRSLDSAYNVLEDSLEIYKKNGDWYNRSRALLQQVVIQEKMLHLLKFIQEEEQQRWNDPSPTNKGSKGQQYILLDTLKDNRKPLYQRPYNYRELVRAGYAPDYFKGRKYMTFKWYTQLYNRK